VQRIGWAIHTPKASVFEVISGVFTAISIPCRIDQKASTIEAGESSEFTLSVTTDDQGVTQVEWARTGAACLDLKRVYSAVQNALDLHYAEGECLQRYGREVTITS